jgi:hypothetical protein
MAESSSNDSTFKNMTYHDPEHKFEKGYWGDCVNTFLEEQKHFVQAPLTGLEAENYRINAGGKRVLDIGGGPVSMLLKTHNLKEGFFCDPIRYTEWVYARYRAKRNILHPNIWGGYRSGRLG